MNTFESNKCIDLSKSYLILNPGDDISKLNFTFKSKNVPMITLKTLDTYLELHRKPRGQSIDDPPKRTRGRPRNSLIVTHDGENRKYKVNTIYLKNKYHTDPVFREKCKQRRRDKYLELKNKVKMGDT
jgi:hypothetical protein